MTSDANPGLRVAFHVMAFTGIGLAGTVGLFLILSALSLGVAGFYFFAFLAGNFPIVAAMIFLSALGYSLLMELWYWSTNQGGVALILYSAFVGSMAGLLMIFAGSPFAPPLSLAFFSACGATLGVIVGSLDWFGQILSAQPESSQPGQNDPA